MLDSSCLLWLETFLCKAVKAFRWTMLPSSLWFCFPVLWSLLIMTRFLHYLIFLPFVYIVLAFGTMQWYDFFYFIIIVFIFSISSGVFRSSPIKCQCQSYIWHIKCEKWNLISYSILRSSKCIMLFQMPYLLFVINLRFGTCNSRRWILK